MVSIKASAHLVEHAHDCQLGAHSLAASSRRSHQAAVVAVVQGREDLRLDWIERVKALEQHFKGWVAQGAHRQWLQVQELRGWEVLFRQQEVPEGDGQRCLTLKPFVTHNLG